MVNHATDRQKQVLGIIASKLTIDGYPPTFRELADALGIRSLNGVHEHLQALQRRGLVRLGDRAQWAASRAIALTDEGWNLSGVGRPAVRARADSTARVVPVTIGARCAYRACDALRFDASKPCPVCVRRSKERAA
jgi:SOS-response transcriptional repressor LexA